jgi:hypothetical protein
MKLKEKWIAEPVTKLPELVEEWRVMRFIKNKPVLTVQPNGWGYSNAKLEKSFYYIDVYYKFIDNGIKFSYDEKKGYKPLMKYIKFPTEYVPTNNKNVYILEKIGTLKYKMIKMNKNFKISIKKSYEQD